MMPAGNYIQLKQSFLTRKWHVVLVGGNNEIRLSSQNYASKWNAYRAAKKLADELEIEMTTTQPEGESDD